jgi:hypothetical protein
MKSPKRDVLNKSRTMDTVQNFDNYDSQCTLPDIDLRYHRMPDNVGDNPILIIKTIVNTH